MASVNRRVARILFVVTVLASTLVQSSSGQGVFSGGFERDVNRYRWSALFQLSEPINGWQIDLSNTFRSDAFILFDDRLSFRDENRTNLTVEKPFGDKRVAVYGSMGWFSLSRVLSQNLVAGYRFPVAEKFFLEPLLGASLDQRPGFSEGPGRAPLRTDAGPAVGVRFDMPATTVDAYSVSLSGEGLIQSMAPRRGEMFRINAIAERTFDGTRLRTQVQAARIRRDAYQAASFLNRNDQSARVAETVESTRSDTLSASVLIERPVSSSTVIGGRLDFSTNSRTVETLRAPDEAIFFDSVFQRRVLEGELSSTFARDQSLLRVSVRAGAEVEDRQLSNEAELPPAQASQKQNLLRQADYDRGFFQAQFDFRTPVGGRTVLQGKVSANIFRHDTPKVNPDDRDELYYNGLFGVSFRLTRYVELQLQLFGTSYHTVYLKSERSAENNVQRSLRFKPTVIWRPSQATRINLTTEVRANYTIDDFLLPGRRPTDQSARELSYTLDAEHDFGGGIRLRVNGRWSDLRLGRFLDETFAEIPLDTLRTTSTWVRINVGTKIQAEIGMRLFIRSDFDRAITIRYDRDDGSGLTSTISRSGKRKISQIGPTTSLVWPLRGGAYLRIDGWATFQIVNSKLYGDLPVGSEQTIRAAAQKGIRTLIPNLAVTMYWPF
ncbi:MAG: hypothetical protein BMS9Abin05_0724 [Rhodothermia bacterium]|nr:MAG: hypothetical protein BMS9Abin05_0724 [Rhodothermia bacterium]